MLSAFMMRKKVTEQCNQMSPCVRALFTVCEIDDKVVVSAEIPGQRVHAEAFLMKKSWLTFCRQ